MDVQAVIRRRSALVDSSGATPPMSLSVVPTAFAGGGVYTQAVPDFTGTGRVSLGILAAALVGAGAFYLWTRSIQGGG